MNRRSFLKSGAAAGGSLFVPVRGSARSAANDTDTPSFGIVADRVALLAELALFERVCFHGACGPAVFRREIPDHGASPVPHGLDRVMVVPGENGCGLSASAFLIEFHSGGDDCGLPVSGFLIEFHSRFDAECSGEGAVSVPLRSLLSWLAAAGDDDSAVTLRQRASGWIEARCGEHRLRVPSLPIETSAAESGLPPLPRTSTPPGARPLPGLDGSWLADHLHACALNFPSTEITIPQALDRLDSEAVRRDRLRRVLFFPGDRGAPNGNPARRKPKVSLVLRFETMLQWMVLARAVGAPDRVLDDGARVFFECGNRLLVSSRFPDGFPFPRLWRCALALREGDTRIATFSPARALAGRHSLTSPWRTI